MIRVDKLNKVYAAGEISVHALRDVSLDIKEGEFVSVMGPSGSGKSTLMNILGCLDRPSNGSYVLDNLEIAGLEDSALSQIRNKKIGFVFQNFHLLPRLTAQRNVELPMLYAGTPVAERKKMAQWALGRVSLQDRGHHKPNELSGGQKQRVAIARSLVNKPAIILADEPTGNLDTRSSEEIMAIFQELNREGATIVIVTHEREIAEHTNRVLYFRDGRLVQDEQIENPISATEYLAKLGPVEVS